MPLKHNFPEPGKCGEVGYAREVMKFNYALCHFLTNHELWIEIKLTELIRKLKLLVNAG
jgi:hypothetical protein